MEDWCVCPYCRPDLWSLTEDIGKFVLHYEEEKGDSTK